MIEIRLPRVADEVGCRTLAAAVIGEERAGAFIRSHLERHHLIVAEALGEIVGFLAYRSDWFQCTFVSLVVVRDDFRRKGIAREFFKSVEAVSPTPRLYSSTEETNVVSIQMHSALGFQPSGHIDNLPQGVRELLFYKRIPPRWGQVLHSDISVPADPGNRRENVGMQDLTPIKGGEPAMSEKTTLLSEAETEFTLFKRAIAGLDEARMRQVWLGTWSARDIVAHISGWHREMAPALERLARGERPIAEGVSYEDVDAWNGRFAEAKRSATTADILAELDASHAAFMRAAAAVPEERYVPGKTAHKIVDLNSRHHYQEHRGQIEAWRKAR